MTRLEALDFLSRLRARHIHVRLDGTALDISGPATTLDREQLRLYASAVADALRPPETGAPPPAQATPASVPRPSDAVPESRFWRGKLITADQIRRCLEGSGDYEDYQMGRLDADTAYRMTRAWLKQEHETRGMTFTPLD